MIKIDVVEPNTAEWKSWVKACKAEQKLLNKAHAAKKARRIKSDLYKGKQDKYKIHSSFFFTKDSPPFYGKCVYCEENIFRNQHGDVEHFRPKGAVDDIRFSRIKIGRGKTLRNHPGYFWLTYDWTNLISSCQLCNQISTKHSEGNKIGKWNRFPVDGKHATKPSEVAKEEPLLINPASGQSADDPAKHLQVDETGVMIASTLRGQACIDVFGLNFRDLPSARKEVYKQARIDFAAYLKACEDDPNGQVKSDLEKKILDFTSGKATHSAAGREGIKVAIENARVTAAIMAAKL